MIRVARGSLLFFVVAVAACSEEPECNVSEPSCPDPMPRYADVEPIFSGRCTVAGCHAGGTSSGPWPLDSYDHVADWYDLIGDALRSCAMPPPDSSISMSTEEREAVLAWLACGHPE